MRENEDPAVRNDGDSPDSHWYRVYLLVAVVTVLVITSLGLFTYYFSG